MLYLKLIFAIFTMCYITLIKENKMDKKFSKENLLNLANATKNKVANIGEATKNAAVSVAENIKESSDQISDKLDKRKFENDKKKLCPIFKDEITSPEFILPALIHVVDYDKRMENKACVGAVGFYSGKDIKMLNIYREFVDLLKVDFYPIIEEAVYYVDHCFNNLYIKLDDYFAYLKKMRVDELIAVARDLGAKHVEIILKSNTKSSKNESSSRSLGIGGVFGGESSLSRSKNDSIGVEVAAKVDFIGNEQPCEPKLVYFKNESDINTLIKMRLDSENGNKILSKTYSLQYGNSSGIKVSEAQKIDATLSNVSGGVSSSVTNEALSENSTILEYSISF